MKRIFLLLLTGMFYSPQVFAQKQTGLSGQLILSHSIKENYSNTTRPLNFGVRVEGMKTKLGRDEFRFAYIGIAAEALSFTKETFTTQGVSVPAGNDTTIQGTLRGNSAELAIHIGFEVPQPWYPFLYFNIGFGGGFGHYVQKSDLNETTVGFYANYGQQRNYHSIKGYGYESNIFFSVFYEQDKFYFFFQEEFVANISEASMERGGLRSNLGIYYKLKTEE